LKHRALGNANGRIRHKVSPATEQAWLDGWLAKKSPLRTLWEAKQAPALWSEVMEKKTMEELKRAVLESKLERSVTRNLCGPIKEDCRAL
jgi:hypothetical protein